VSDAGALPEPARDIRPLDTDVAGDDFSIRGQRERNCERAVAGEDADFKTLFRASRNSLSSGGSVSDIE
jgi:hypothetical protein